MSTQGSNPTKLTLVFINLLFVVRVNTALHSSLLCLFSRTEMSPLISFSVFESFAVSLSCLSTCLSLSLTHRYLKKRANK